MPKDAPSTAANAPAAILARTPTPFADRAIALIEDLSKAVDGLHAKALSYHDAGVAKDMHPSVEAHVRMTVRSMTTLVDQLNCPVAYIPGVTPLPAPPHFGDASSAEAQLLKSKAERAAKVNAIPLSTAAQAKAQAAEAHALQGMKGK